MGAANGYTISLREQDANMLNNNTGAGANTQPTGRELQESLGANVRTFQKWWKAEFGRPFNANRICSAEEVERMVSIFDKKGKPVKQDTTYNQENQERSKVRKTKTSINSTNAPAPNEEDKVPEQKTRPETRNVNWYLIAALALPTVASVLNTYNVSHALSKYAWTGLFITGVVSLTAFMFIMSKARHFLIDWLAMPLTILFEAFCNATSVFNTIMGEMSYYLTRVTGKPSEFLDMVATFTGRDHRDCAVTISLYLAATLAIVQLVAICNIRKSWDG